MPPSGAATGEAVAPVLSAVAHGAVPGRAWYMVWLCMVAYVFSHLDRQIISMLIGPIRADLQISDTQFSLIHGLAFAIFYGLMGVPIARLADSRSRPLIISCGIALWSIATAACGLARNFWQLFAARMAVGFGEAALSPAAYSMIADSFPRERLGLALGIYSAGAFLGTGLAFLVGGAVIEAATRMGPQELPLFGVVKPWQMTLFMVGLPGVVLAAMFWTTIRDPERTGTGQDGAAGYPVAAVVAYIRAHGRSFLSHYTGYSCLALSLFALLYWAPAWLFRNYGLSPRDAGILLGTFVLVGNTAGVISSGLLIDRFSRRGRTDAALLAAIAGGLGVVLPALLFPWLGGLWPSLTVLGLAMYFGSFPLATSAAALQMMAPNRMRAQVTSLFFLVLNIVGITGGATLVALCTDFLFRDEQMVGYSMSLVSAAGALAGVLLLSSGLGHYRATAGALAAQAAGNGGRN